MSWSPPVIDTGPGPRTLPSSVAPDPDGAIRSEVRSLATVVKGRSREATVAEIDRLIGTGVLGHDKARFGPHKLVLMPDAQEVQF